jgi:hypothetical protein
MVAQRLSVGSNSGIVLAPPLTVAAPVNLLA